MSLELATPREHLPHGFECLGPAKRQIPVSWFGMHHFGWLFDLAVDGQSRLDAVFGQLERMANLGVDPEIVTALRPYRRLISNTIFIRTACWR
jgi:hypothetical protein